MRNVLFVVFMFLSVSLFGQQQTHTVGKGETLESIASKYGVSVTALKQKNPRLTKVYYGMKVVIPAKGSETPVESSQAVQPVASALGAEGTVQPLAGQTESPSLSASASSGTGFVEETISRPALAYIGFAEDYIKEGKHKKAIKELDKSIEVQESMKARWLRGKCYYYEEKWKKSLDDLDFVRNHPAADEDIRSQANVMYGNAFNYHAEKRAERAELWTKIGAGALLAVAVVGTAAIAGKSASSSSGSDDVSSSGTSASSDSEVSSSSSGGYASSQEGYQRIYDTHANTAEGLFNTLTDGNTRGIENGSAAGVRKQQRTGTVAASYSTIKPKLDKVQREMVKIRQEAESKGFSIRASEYETATVY